MRLIYLQVFIFLCLASASLNAQSYHDLYVNGDNSFYIDITVSKGYTLYGMSRSTGQSVEEILNDNHKISNDLSIGEELRLKVNAAMIFNSREALKAPASLYYTVSSGDNLYQISKRFGQETNDLIALNAKTSTSLDIGDKLLIGWINWPFDKEEHMEFSEIHRELLVVPHLAKANILPIISNASINITNVPTFATSTLNLKPVAKVKEKGIAFWEKAKYKGHELIVMHPHARVNSSISLYNPMLKRKVNAKVVSELPKGAYPNDVSVVISPSVANALGALDSRFLVEITYVE